MRSASFGPFLLSCVTIINPLAGVTSASAGLIVTGTAMNASGGTATKAPVLIALSKTLNDAASPNAS